MYEDGLIEEVNVNEVNEETSDSSGIGTGLAVLIGSGLTVAVIAGGMKLKKVWTNHKAKKERVLVESPDGVVSIEKPDSAQ